MEYFLIIFYAVGVILCFRHLEKMFNDYKKNHIDEISVSDRQYEESIIICTSLFSWIAYLILIAGDFCGYGDGRLDGNYDDDLEDSDNL